MVRAVGDIPGANPWRWHRGAASRKLGLYLLVSVTAAAAVAFDAVYPAWFTPYVPREPASFTLVIAAVGAVYLAVGIAAWHERPDSRIGPLMIAVGAGWLAYQLAWLPGSLPVTWGDFTLNLVLPCLAWLALAYPSGRLRFRFERFVLGFTWLIWVYARLVTALLEDPTPTFVGCSGPCPRNLLLVHADPALERALLRWTDLASLGIAAVIVALIVIHWRLAAPRGRRSIAPLLWMTLPPVAWVVVYAIDDARLLSPPPNPWPWLSLALIAIPLGYVFARVRDRLARGAVGDLVVRLGTRGPEANIQQVLARTLRDPTLEVAYWMPEEKQFTDLRGREVVLPPQDDPKRAATILDRGGEPLAVIVHDAAVADDPKLQAAATAAVSMAIENQNLHALVRAQLDEVRASRARIVAAQDAERRRLERDLHDGAQQRLVTLSLALGAVRNRLDVGTDPSLADALDTATAELRTALAELRELARGIHPEVLTRAGLLPAIRSLCERTQVPVAVEAEEIGRLPASIEATAYFVVSEALVNVSKHARATRITVRVTRDADRLGVEVVDDGIGGADRRAGTGLRGLEDRVRAVNGRLSVTSPAGGGTWLAAEIPCGW